MANKKTIITWQIYLGLVLVVTGGLFLADQLLALNLLRFFWPLLIILFGLTFFVGMLVAGKKASGLAVPGTLLTVIGLILFVQNTFDLWVTWAYAWALLITATGVGLLIMNAYHKREGLRRTGGLIMGLGLILFVMFGVLFEVILNIAGTSSQSGLFLGGGLVLLGVFVLFSRAIFAHKPSTNKRQEEDPEVIEGSYTAAETQPEPGEASVQPLAGDEEFTTFDFKSLGQVFVTQGDHCGLKIEGSPDIIQHVTAEVNDGVLMVHYELNVVDWTGLQWINEKDRIRYFVTVKSLEQIILGGAGSISADALVGQNLGIVHAGIGVLKLTGLQFEEVDVDLSGLGEVMLAGKVESQNLDLSGAGSYQAVRLQSQHANLSLSGAGSAKVWAEATLNGRISGAGSIQYKGSPQIEESLSGLGKIKPI